MGAINCSVGSSGGCVSVGGDDCGVEMFPSLFGGRAGGDGKLVLNNLLRCLGVNQGSGSLMSSGSSSISVGGITGSVGDSLGITGSVGDSLLVSMLELIRPCSWRLLLRLH